MILTMSITFLLGTLASAEPPLSSPVVENVVNVQNPYYPLYQSGISNYLEKPHLLHLSAHLPPQLQHLFHTIENHNCEKSPPIVSPFVVNEFIKEPAKFSEHLKNLDGHFSRIPLYAVNDKPLLIAEPPKLPELSAKDLEVLRKKYSEDFIEKQHPKTTVIVPPAPELPPITVPKLPSENVEEPHLTVQLNKKENTITIPEPPKLPQLTIEELGRLKQQVQKEHEITKQELPLENKPVMVSELPNLPGLAFTKLEHLRHPDYAIESQEPETHSTVVVIPSGPQLPQMIIPELPRYSSTYLPCEHLDHSTESRKFPVMVEEVQAFKPHDSLQLAKEVKPHIIPEPPKLPELSLEELRRLRNEVPKYVEVISELPGKHIEHASTVPKFQTANEEVPYAKPHVIFPTIPEPPKLPQLSSEEVRRLTLEIPKYVETSTELPVKHIELSTTAPKFNVDHHVILPAIPEPPSLPQLSVEELGRLKDQVQKYEIPKKVPEKHTIVENKPVIVESPKVTELTFNKVPEFVIEREQPKSHLTTVIIPPAPQLPAVDLRELPSQQTIPCGHPSHLKMRVPLNPHPILMSHLLNNSNLDKMHEAHTSNLFLKGAVPYIGPLGLRLHEW